MAMQRPEKAGRHAAIQGLSPKERSPGRNRRQTEGVTPGTGRRGRGSAWNWRFRPALLGLQGR